MVVCVKECLHTRATFDTGSTIRNRFRSQRGWISVTGKLLQQSFPSQHARGRTPNAANRGVDGQVQSIFINHRMHQPQICGSGGVDAGTRDAQGRTAPGPILPKRNGAITAGMRPKRTSVRAKLPKARRTPNHTRPQTNAASAPPPARVQ